MLSLDIVWFKRDLRLDDNQAIRSALSTGRKVLLVFIWEDFYFDDHHYDIRHRSFISESIADLDRSLAPQNSRVAQFRGEAVEILERIRRTLPFGAVYSHQETGIQRTYLRDLAVGTYLSERGIPWKEYAQNGVIRGLRSRNGWKERWVDFVRSPLTPFSAKPSQLLALDEIELLEKAVNRARFDRWNDSGHLFQKGGRSAGLKTLDSFLKDRFQDYQRNISRPLESRESCSRLSPYISWGNLSIREIYQRARNRQQELSDARKLSGFLSRLRWQAHFVQKFEMECRMEFEPVNRGYLRLEKPGKTDWLSAWESGQTGFPLVDASIRCLKATGYLNFRMRALTVSFATHLLWQPWQSIGQFLAAQFLDFEPGIHYPQIQMQAGETGINQVRIYNPLKNARRLDPEAQFVKAWIPELRHLPAEFALQPGLLTPLERQFYGFKLDRDYPAPIIDGEKQWRHASAILYGMQKDSLVLQESARILRRHTLADRNPWDE